jgi:hypothetical protein
MNSEEYLSAAFQALLRGDTAERDRLCKEAERALKQEEMNERARAVAKVLSVDFYVKIDGTAISSKVMYAAAN